MLCSDHCTVDILSIVSIMFVIMITIYIDRLADGTAWSSLRMPGPSRQVSQDLKDAAAAAATEKEFLPSFPWKKKKKKGPVMMR